MSRSKLLSLFLLACVFLVPLNLSETRALRAIDATPEIYTPPVTGLGSCPFTSTREYSGGKIYQHDKDDPVRPAYHHADKNIELRGYTLNTDTGFERDLVDHGSDDPTQPPQFATLFDPYRVPELANFYRVHHWDWAPSPQPGQRLGPIEDWPVTALGLGTTPGETLHVPKSGYDLGGEIEAMVLFADDDTIALHYTRDDSSALGYTVHIDNICTDPNLLALYEQLDDPDGPRYDYPNDHYNLPNLTAGQPFGVAGSDEIVVAIVDTGSFMDPRSLNEWWQIRPVYPAVRADQSCCSAPGGGPRSTSSGNEAYEQEIVERVNAVRAENDLPPLKRAAALGEAARYHAEDMAQNDYFEHDSFPLTLALSPGGEGTRSSHYHLPLTLATGRTWIERVASYYLDPQSLAENIAAGYTAPEGVMNAWLDSLLHQDNILSAKTWEIGVGYYEGGSRGSYWVQDFGRRGGVYPLVIEREAEATDSRSVSLYIYGDQDGWDEMRLRNDQDGWGDWRPFQSTPSWELPMREGEHTVWAELRDGDATTVSSDTIRLDQVFTPTLGGLPDELSFTYSISDAQLLPAAHLLTPQNVGSDETLTWTLDSQGTWFEVQPTGGATPAFFAITPTAFSTSTVTTYTGLVTVTSVTPLGVEQSPRRIDLTLRVVSEPFSYIYLPLVARNCAPPARSSTDACYTRK